MRDVEHVEVRDDQSEPEYIESEYATNLDSPLMDCCRKKIMVIGQPPALGSGWDVIPG